MAFSVRSSRAIVLQDISDTAERRLPEFTTATQAEKFKEQEKSAPWHNHCCCQNYCVNVLRSIVSADRTQFEHDSLKWMSFWLGYGSAADYCLTGLEVRQRIVSSGKSVLLANSAV